MIAGSFAHYEAAGREQDRQYVLRRGQGWGQRELFHLRGGHKGEVSTLTRSMARQLISDGILANAVAPGRVDIPFHDEFTSDEKREAVKEVAEAVLFLSAPRTTYVLGEVIEVNGRQLID